MAANYQSYFDDADNYKKDRVKRMYRKKFSSKADPASDKRSSKYSRYEKWSRYDLDRKAAELGIDDSVHMNKQRLIDLLAEY